MADSILIIGLGFTGKLVLQYLSKHPEKHTFKLQAGGRSPSKILATIADAGATAEDVKVVVFDLSNYDDVEKAVLGATVVINCAGPFFRYGENVVRACAKHGKQYTDISGETHFQANALKYDFIAYKTGATIIPGCCFDSIPSDLSTYTSVQTLKALVGPDTKVAKSTSAMKMTGGFSGGTAATFMSMFEEVTPAQLKRGSRPYALSPIQGRPVPYPRLIYSIPEVTHKPIVGGYFLMSSSNVNIVRRTWGLLQTLSSTSEDRKFAYGEEFEYDEFMQTPTKTAALMLSLTIYTGALLAFTFAPFRWFLKKFVLPVSGEGPSPESFTKSMFQITNVTTSVPSPSYPRRRTARTVFTGHGDPGYFLGSIMVSECAIALLPSNRSKLTALGQAGGILTPMTAFGNLLTDRLVATGKFDISTGELIDGGATESKKIA